MRETADSYQRFRHVRYPEGTLAWRRTRFTVSAFPQKEYVKHT